MEHASKRMFEFAFIGLALAGALIVGLQARPSTLLPFTGTLSVQLTDSSPYSPASDDCHDCPVTSLVVRIDSVMVHREGALNLTGGWFEASQGATTLDIAQLTSRSQIIGQASLPPGIINLVRLTVSSANATLAPNGTPLPVRIPSGKIDVVLGRQAEVRSGMTTIVVLDFPSSIICEGNGDMCRVKPVLLTKVVGPR